jgi:glycosyltransferase involved in cell wall biosynthesis
MKILYHHRTLGDGAEGIHVASMVKAFGRLGHEVRVSSLIGEQTNVSTPRTRRLTSVVRLTPRPLYELMELGYSVVGYRALMKLVREWRPDVLYERYSLFNLAGVAVARRAGIPLVLEVNAPLAWERAHYERLSLRRVASRCEAYVCANADVVEVVSTPLAEHLLQLGVSRENVVVVPNGADPAVFQPDAAAREDVRRRFGIPDDQVIVGFSGILRPWHGVELLLEAVGAIAASRRVHVLVVGDGPSRASFEVLAIERGLRGRVTVTGRVAHGDIPKYVAAFDIGVSPRATFYASPMKVPEYMACGVAVVAPRTPNLEDLIQDGKDGCLFEAESVRALSETLAHLVDDRSARVRLGAAARTAIVGGRTWEHNAARVLGHLSARRACA